MTDVERLATAQALFKLLAEVVDTKNPDSLRSHVDEVYRDMYERTGGKSFEVRLGGEKVGTYSVRVSKEVPESTRHKFVVTDAAALREWESDEFNAWLSEWVDANIAKLADLYFHDIGELPDGCELIEVVTPAEPSVYKGGTLKIDDPIKAIELSSLALGQSVAGLLGEGE